MISPSSRIDMAAVLPNFESIQYAEDLFTNAKLIQKEFIRSARLILLGHNLVYRDRGEHHWQINALELYFYHSKFWPDETTHFKRFDAKQQLEWGTWYVHRDGKPAPNWSGIDITAGCKEKEKEIAVGLLIAAIGERRGSATALKTIVRAGKDYIPRRKDKWSDQEKLIIQSIDKKRIDVGALKLESIPETRQIPLWIGPRKISEKQRAKIKEPIIRDSCLRIATFTTTNPLMKLLDQDKSNP
jgi:hypothetical protein